MPPSLQPTRIIISSCEARHEVKRSVFVAFAEPLDSPASAGALLAQHYHGDARHHCWAWRCDGEYRFSDDGEPSGTAGRPILQAIEGAGIERIIVIVQRYFGGIKLGAGGLVRAYSAATAACLQQAVTRQLTPHIELDIHVPFQHTQALFQLGAPYQLSAPQHYSDGVQVTAEVPTSACDSFLAELNNHTRGEARCRKGRERLA